MDAPTAHDATLSALLEKFAQADCCWFSSVRPDGRAHLAPIWHVWHAGSVYVVTRDQSVRARILHSMVEEETGSQSGTKSHADLVLDFVEALGQAPDTTIERCPR